MRVSMIVTLSFHAILYTFSNDIWHFHYNVSNVKFVHTRRMVLCIYLVTGRRNFAALLFEMVLLWHSESQVTTISCVLLLLPWSHQCCKLWRVKVSAWNSGDIWVALYTLPSIPIRAPILPVCFFIMSVSEERSCIDFLSTLLFNLYWWSDCLIDFSISWCDLEPSFQMCAFERARGRVCSSRTLCNECCVLSPGSQCFCVCMLWCFAFSACTLCVLTVYLF